MARALVALLVLTMGSMAARNDDYLGSHMPNYGSAYDSKDNFQSSDEYPERSPDAALSHDYKYEEDEHSIDDKAHVKHMPSNTWTYGKKNKPLKYPDDEDIDQDDYENDKNSDKTREEHVLYKFRPNSRSRKKHYYDSDIDNKGIENSRRRIKDEYSIDNRGKINLMSREQVREGNRAIYNKANNRFQRRENTGRKPRRKPRDRAINREVLNSDTGESKEQKIRPKEEESMEEDYPARRDIIDLEDSPKPNKTPFEKNNAEYEEYFDMKRINRIKDKLISPISSRSTKVSASETSLLPDIHTSQQWPNRRANLQENLPSTVNTSINIVTPRKVTITTRSTTVIKTKLKVTPELPTNKTVLSLAEKSRLSILKKAQRKENLKNLNQTTKPPVLMQVTQRMQTLVMVERRNQKDLNTGPKEISEDSPDRVALARQLMRHKLVAGAKSVQDLTDNWDEMVCDYIDTSLLNNGEVIGFNHMKYVSVLLFSLIWVRFL